MKILHDLNFCNGQNISSKNEIIENHDLTNNASFILEFM